MSKFNSSSVENLGPIEEIFTDGMSVFNDFAQDRGLLDSVDSETINLGGSEIDVYLYQGDSNYDDLYDEERVKVLSPVPKSIVGHFEPVTIEEHLGEFGIELQTDQVFTFNKTDIEERLGRSLRPGDVLKPAFYDAFYTVHEVQEDSFESYGVYHLVVQAKFWRDSEYVYRLRQSEVPLDISGVFHNVTVMIALSDGYLQAWDLKWIGPSRRRAFPSKKLPINIIAHGGPSNRERSKGAGIFWAEQGFFSMTPDIRGRGSSMLYNDASLYGRETEDGIRHRLDIWEAIEIISQGDRGYYKYPYLDKEEKMWRGAPDTITGKEVVIEKPPQYGHLMDLYNIVGTGFSLPGATPLYMSIDSGHSMAPAATRNYLNRFDYDNHEVIRANKLESTGPWINPQTWKPYDLNDRFRTLKAASLGGALINSKAHLFENGYPGAIKHHFGFFTYTNKDSHQWFDMWDMQNNPLIGSQKDIHFKRHLLGIWFNPLMLLAFEHFWDRRDWKSWDDYLTGKWKFAPGGYLTATGDPSSMHDPGTSASYMLPRGYDVTGGYHAGTKYYYDYVCGPSGWNTSCGPDPEASAGWLAYPVLNISSTSENLSQQFEDKEDITQRWVNSNTHILYRGGVDDIFMSHTLDMPWVYKRKLENPSVETHMWLMLTGAHGSPPYGRESHMINERDLAWLRHYAFGEDMLEKAHANHLDASGNFIQTIVPNTVLRYQGKDPEEKRRFVTFNTWPPPTSHLPEFLLYASGTNQSFPASFTPPNPPTDAYSDTVEHPLFFGGGSEGEGQMSAGDGNPDPIPVPGEGGKYRRYYRYNIERLFRNTTDHAILVPGALTDMTWVASSTYDFNPIDFNSSALLVGATSATLTVSADVADFQLWVEMLDVDESGSERFIAGGLYSQVSAFTPVTPDNIYTFTYELDPYAYEMQAGHQLRIRAKNMSHKAPPYVEGNEVLGIPGSKFPIANGIYTGLPAFNEFNLKIRLFDSKIKVPINNDLGKVYM
jgi:hypothetical protein